MHNMYNPDIRPNWTDYFLRIAYEVATRSTCLKRQVGAVLVRNKRILATGYNGAPMGIRHCASTGCLRQDSESGTNLENCKALHAEQNAIIQSAFHGVSTKDSVLYCTASPCSTCAKMIINAGVSHVIYDAQHKYPDPFGDALLKEAEVSLLEWWFDAPY